MPINLLKSFKNCTNVTCLISWNKLNIFSCRNRTAFCQQRTCAFSTGTLPVKTAQVPGGKGAGRRHRAGLADELVLRQAAYVHASRAAVDVRIASYSRRLANIEPAAAVRRASQWAASASDVSVTRYFALPHRWGVSLSLNAAVDLVTMKVFHM